MLTLTQKSNAEVSSLDSGSYEMRPVAATMYRASNNASLYDSSKEDKIVPQMSIHWEAVEEIEDVDGVLARHVIELAYVTYSLNAQAKLVKILKALLPKTFSGSSKVTFELEGGVENVSQLPMKDSGEIEVLSMSVDGIPVLGNEDVYAVLGLELKDNGYNRVTSFSAPVKRGGSSKRPT